MPTMRLRALLIAPAVLALAACGSDNPSPEEQKRAEQCASFERLDPGFLEISRATQTLADPNSTRAERSAALKAQLDQQSTSEKRTEPYDCDDPADAELFGWYISEYGA